MAITNDKLLLEIGRVMGSVEALIKTVEHNSEQSITGDESILKVLDDFTLEMRNSLKDHFQYHEDYEEKFGIPMWIRNHSKQTILFCVFVGIMLSSVFGFTIAKTIEFYRTVNTLVP